MTKQKAANLSEVLKVIDDLYWFYDTEGKSDAYEEGACNALKHAYGKIELLAKQSKVCEKFEPNSFYASKRQKKYCVRQFCKHWVREMKRCVDLDPAAGSTYEITEAHCSLKIGDEVNGE